jgi:hypothetical protein
VNLTVLFEKLEMVGAQAVLGGSEHATRNRAKVPRVQVTQNAIPYELVCTLHAEKPEGAYLNSQERQASNEDEKQVD